MLTSKPPSIFEVIKALDCLEDTFDRGFDTLAAKVEALPTAERPQFPEADIDDAKIRRMIISQIPC
jgi:hypothetical protein